jgi:hypothetical protein
MRRHLGPISFLDLLEKSQADLPTPPRRILGHLLIFLFSWGSSMLNLKLADSNFILVTMNNEEDARIQTRDGVEFLV